MRAFSLLLLLPLAACSRDQTPAPAAPPDPAGGLESVPEVPAERPPNVLLISLSSTRPDRLGSYGHGSATTRHLDRLASLGARFERAYAQVPLTLPAHASLLTGAFPPEHGLHDNGRGALGTGLGTLAESFRARGFRTAAFVASMALNSVFGLDRGFELFDDEVRPAADGSSALERPGVDVVDSALTWLRRAKDEPFFCWVNLGDPAFPFAPPPPFDQRHGDPYDGEIAYMDSQIGRLLGWLDSELLLERTLVVAVGDHGLGLGAHGESGHGALLFEGTQRIPLLIAAAGRVRPGSVVEDPVQQVDLLPTLFELQGWTPPEGTGGRSLLPLLGDAPQPERAIYLESRYAAIHFGWAPLHGVVLGRLKWIEAPTPRLFDLQADPGELENLAERRADEADLLRRALRTLRDSMRRPPEPDPRRTEEFAARLASLGYDPRGSAERRARPLDPLDQVELLERFQRAIALGFEGRTDEMIEPLESLVVECPDAPGFRALLGITYVESGRVEEGIGQLEQVIAIDPAFEPSYFHLGRAHLAAGDLERAAAHFRLTLALQPASLGARAALAEVLSRQGDADGARELYEWLTVADARNELHWLNLAQTLSDLGRQGEFVATLERGVVATGGGAGLRSYLAWTLATTPVESLRDPARALELAEARAAETGRRDPHALDILAVALAAQDRFPEAIRTAEEALGLAQGLEDPMLVQELEDRLEAYRRGLRIIDG